MKNRLSIKLYQKNLLTEKYFSISYVRESQDAHLLLLACAFPRSLAHFLARLRLLQGQLINSIYSTYSSLKLYKIQVLNSLKFAQF